MDVLTAIENRASALKLTEPGPSEDQLRRIIGAGTRAPDHGRLSPWRFVILEGERRSVLAGAMSALRRRLTPGVSDDEAAREGEKAYRAPTIIAVAARTAADGKIPEIERLLAVGAAMQNMILAAHALGFGTMWKTGQAAYDSDVKTSLGLMAADHIVGFLYLGTTAAPGAPRASAADEFIIRP